MNPEVRATLGVIGGLLLLAGGVLFIVPAANIWPFVLLFWAVGLGLLIGTVMSLNAESERSNTQGPTTP